MATIKKGPGPKSVKMTPMQKLKKMYPTADTSARGDIRFEDLAPLDRYDKKDQKRITDIQEAFDKKYGKDKPAKNKKGGVTKKKMKTGGTLAPSKKSVGKTIGKLNKAKHGGKTHKSK